MKISYNTFDFFFTNILAGKIILDSDGVVVVSAEYNHSIPPALSNVMV